MEITQKKVKSLVEGDILILDMLSPMAQKIKLGDFGKPRQLKAKYEGETAIILYEIDDKNSEYINGKNTKDGVSYTFYHMESLFGKMPDLTFFDGNEKVDVILNPHQLNHYKEYHKKCDELRKKAHEVF